MYETGEPDTLSLKMAELTQVDHKTIGSKLAKQIIDCVKGNF